VRSYTREWPEDRWVTLAKRLAALQGGGKMLFVITGSPSDQVRSDPFVRKLRELGLEAETFVGRDGFATLCQILLHARLVVSVNTGVMHLSAILNAPTISLNGPNSNGRWGPVGSRAIGIESPGKGCGYLHLGFESGATDCMERITVEMVLAAADDLLGIPSPIAGSVFAHSA
jgi:ADP-heptose:LPS heptosyltransferase